MRIDIPADKDPLMYVWGEAVPGIGPAAAAYSSAVYAKSTLPLREFEAARYRIAQINGCQFCLTWRTERDGSPVPEAFYPRVDRWADAEAELSDRERLAAELAERYAVAHTELDDDLWARLRGAFTDEEVVELLLCIGAWIAFGRLNTVLGLDTACALPTF